MLISLFIFEIILAMLVILTTCMVESKFKAIEKSLYIYGNSRAYKTQQQIALIEKIINRYKECGEDTDEEPDLESIIKHYLCKEYIGRFSYVGVKNVALRLKGVMWGVILVEGSIAVINQMGNVMPTIIIITMSILLTIAIAFFCIIRGLEERSEALIIVIQDYVLNTYPLEMKKSLQNKELMRLKDRIMELEREIVMEENTSEKKKSLETLSESIQEEKALQKNTDTGALNAQDIAKLIGIFQ